MQVWLVLLHNVFSVICRRRGVCRTPTALTQRI